MALAHWTAWLPRTTRPDHAEGRGASSPRPLSSSGVPPPVHPTFGPGRPADGPSGSQHGAVDRVADGGSWMPSTRDPACSCGQLGSHVAEITYTRHEAVALYQSLASRVTSSLLPLASRLRDEEKRAALCRAAHSLLFTSPLPSGLDKWAGSKKFTISRKVLL
eukprot:jgi/Mesvir1/13732/Mv06943-RA.1